MAPSGQGRSSTHLVGAGGPGLGCGLAGREDDDADGAAGAGGQ